MADNRTSSKIVAVEQKKLNEDQLKTFGMVKGHGGDFSNAVVQDVLSVSINNSSERNKLQ